tara:strand:+ start:29830 stop:31869 length:2040 start_codon:yes stop_codon:yes gene_type:complete
MITATGIGSGLDIESLVTQLVAAERSPVENRLTRREISLTAELSAFGQFKGALAGFQGSLSDISNLSTFGQRTASSSNEDILTVSAGGSAAAASYDLTVSQLAKAHSLASGSYASIDDVVGTGTLNFRFGTTDYTSPDPGPESYNAFTLNPERGTASVVIDSSNNTLEGMRDAINEADIGVAAAIVNDGSGYRLLLSSEATGAANSMEVSVTDTGDGNDTDAAGLSAFAFNAAAINVSQTVAAQDALFTVNGLTIASSENTATDVIDGIDITLRDLTGTAPVSINVSQDKAGVKETITDFVEAYNNLINTIDSLTAYDPNTGNAGPLQGDFSARSIVSQMRRTVVNAVEGFNGPFQSLSEIGIGTQLDGTLAVDSGKLDTALDDNFDQVAGLFAAVGYPTDSGIDFLSSSDATAVTNHAIEISQIATQGQLTGAVANFPLVIDADNDSFNISINGVASDSIILTQGTYASGAELAAELQARINGDANLRAGGNTASVDFNAGQFTITANEYGSSSNVEITAVDTNTAAQLGLSVAAGTVGVDVAGTIGGVAALGSGQILTGAATSQAEGLQLLINGGALGARGSVDFSRGIAYQLNKMVDSFLEADGVLDSRTDSIQDRVEDIADRREALDRRLEALEARYRSQFTSLDTLLSQLQSTSSFLTQQLASLPGARSQDNDN